MTTLFINACFRKDSRTKDLADYVLSKIGGDLKELDLVEEQIKPLNNETLELRDGLIAKQDYSNAMFDYAKEFANADIIVIATPCYDLSFSALVKNYIENINVIGITFEYNDKGECIPLCKAKKLVYITTSGGYIESSEYGFGYIKALCNTFYGIKDVKYYKAEGLDIDGANVAQIINNAKKEINKDFI